MTNLKTLNLIQHDPHHQKVFRSTIYGDDYFINGHNFSLLVNLESLRIEEMSSDPFKSLTKLVNLKNLDVSALSFDLDRYLGAKLEVIGQLKKLQLLTLPFNNDYPIKINEIQRQYPHVKFRWFFENGCHSYYYEGSFNDNNLRSGKGAMVYLSNGGIYEGEFKDGMKNGKGVYNDPTFRYEGEYKNGTMDGKGVYYWSEGDRYEGEFREGLLEGRGIMYWPNGNRFEGEFHEDFAKLGIKYYPNGNRYSGEYSNNGREGKGTMLFSNGNRYEGVYVNDKRAGNGVFYYSNGEIVEGDESVFILNEENGTIEMV